MAYRSASSNCRGEGEAFTVPVHRLPAYATIRALVRDASCAPADAALGGPPNEADLQRAAALGRALELWDPTGALVPVNFIELTEWPGGTPEVAAFIKLRQAHASVPAMVRPRPTADSDASAPAA